MLVLLIIGGTICCVTYFATRHPKDGGGSCETALQQEVEGLHEELTGVRQELSELAERLDFAERMLAKAAGGGAARSAAGVRSLSWRGLTGRGAVR